jgi:hypothetical protein
MSLTITGTAGDASENFVKSLSFFPPKCAEFLERAASHRTPSFSDGSIMLNRRLARNRFRRATALPQAFRASAFQML